MKKPKPKIDRPWKWEVPNVQQVIQTQQGIILIALAPKTKLYSVSVHQTTGRTVHFWESSITASQREGMREARRYREENKGQNDIKYILRQLLGKL